MPKIPFLNDDLATNVDFPRYQSLCAISVGLSQLANQREVSEACCYTDLLAIQRPIYRWRCARHVKTDHAYCCFFGYLLTFPVTGASSTFNAEHTRSFALLLRGLDFSSSRPQTTGRLVNMRTPPV